MIGKFFLDPLTTTVRPNGTGDWASRCIEARRPRDEPIDVAVSVDVTLVKNAGWFAEALASAIEAKCDVNGEKKAMAGHLRRCNHSMVAVKALAAQVSPTKAEQKAAESGAAKRAREPDAVDADDENTVTGRSRQKRKLVKAVEKSFKQSKLETDAIHADPEILKLFMMFRSRAEDVIPSHTQLGGSLLRDASNRIDAQIAEEILDADVMMNILIDLIRINAWGKDGESMALRFAEMIDKAEEKWLCNVVAFLTDNDAGSKKGRKLLAIARAWLLLFPCCGHQGQLILAEYLRDHPRAAEIMEQLIEFVNWLNSKDKSDHVRPDQFLLGLAGLFLHFGSFSARAHANERALGKKMCARIEKRFKELDQAVFVLALVLNSFQKLTRFGDKANIDPFVLSTELIALYKRVKSRPPSTPRTPVQQQQHEQSSNPIPFWEMFRTNALVAKLANFSLMLLYLVVNQAGLECSFSDFANKKNKKRNRLGLVKMGQQAKEGLAARRDGRKNHDEDQIKLLLAVPRYAEALLSDTDDSDDEGAERISVVVKSRAAWQKQMAKWQEELRVEEDEGGNSGGEKSDDNEDDDLPATIAPTAPCVRRPRTWLPISLANLFSGMVGRPIGEPARRAWVVSEESLYMELLAAEHSNEESDAGAQEGSGDDFEG
ncbi:hypothetical protein B0H19DRAFT_1271523 [Mycena capillaripes]|nr:hypothetical protein B0H19DRAFT_1271523 [Mycena capillaripes]